MQKNKTFKNAEKHLKMIIMEGMFFYVIRKIFLVYGLTKYPNDFRKCCTLTARQRGIKESLSGPIRPRTNATARRADTHSA